MYKRILGRLAGRMASHQLRRFLDATDRPMQLQRDMLRRQLTILSGSDFFRDHRLDQVDSYRDFAQRVPIRRYEQFAPYIDRLKAGRTDALFSPSEKLVMFTLTSGTTGEPKYIPVTSRFVTDYRRGWNVFGVRALLDHPAAFVRSIIQITSSLREERTAGGIWCGAITGLLAETQKWIVRKHYATPLAVAEIKDPLAKMYAVVRLALTKDVAFISTANPSTVLRLAQTIVDHAGRLIRDVHDGRIRPPGQLADDLADRLGAGLKPDPARAGQLERMCQQAGRLLPKDVWDLGFLANWTGGTLKLYLSRFPEYFGAVPVRDIGLLASEGRFSIPINDGTPTGILEITSNLFEFIPEDDYGSDQPTVLTVDHLRTGQRYFLVISNATGLTRYDLGDLVEVTDMYRHTPMIAFLNKGAHVSSITGEKITEHQVVQAMGVLSEKLGQRIENFLLCPHWDDPPYYVLSVERRDADGRADHIEQQYDHILQQLNIEYQAKRHTLRLGPLRVRVVADGYFAKDDLAQLAATGRSEQYKRKFLCPRVDSDEHLPVA